VQVLDSAYCSDGVLPAVRVEKDGIFVEIGLSARPTRVFVETVKRKWLLPRYLLRQRSSNCSQKENDQKFESAWRITA
jgi:hypothetical protein